MFDDSFHPIGITPTEYSSLVHDSAWIDRLRCPLRSIDRVTTTFCMNPIRCGVLPRRGNMPRPAGRIMGAGLQFSKIWIASRRAAAKGQNMCLSLFLCGLGDGFWRIEAEFVMAF
ncbi:MAG: hypothetical protein CMJ80_08085 [Planctomycetaceae bacterium]|nr:hypothetical protein [Planctomycetaceae bacterium]